MRKDTSFVMDELYLTLNMCIAMLLDHQWQRVRGGEIRWQIVVRDGRSVIGRQQSHPLVKLSKLSVHLTCKHIHIHTSSMRFNEGNKNMCANVGFVETTVCLACPGGHT